MQEIALQKSFVENRSQTTVPPDIPANIDPIEKPDKKSYKINQNAFFPVNVYFKVLLNTTE